MNCSTPGFPVLNYLPECVQTHVHWVRPSNHFILSPPSLLALNLSQNQAGSFPINQLFISGDQSTGALASVLPMNIHGWFPLALTGLISLLSKGLSRVFSSKHHNSKASILQHSAFFMVQLSHLYVTTGKTRHSFDYMDLCWLNGISAFYLTI